MIDIFFLSAVSLLLFAGLLLSALIRADRRRRQLLQRLSRGGSPVAPGAEPKARKPLPSAPTGGLLARLNAQLDRTSLRLTPHELLAQVGIGVLALYGLLVLGTNISPLLAVPLSTGLPLAAAWAVLRLAQAKYCRAFTDGLPETLDVFARGLRAGRPIADSLGIVVETATGPLKAEFARCHGEIRLGAPLAETLARMETRLGTSEVSFFAVATALQSETGGNLIETMENLAYQLRERRQLRRKARALSSEARASAVILASLPFAVGLAIALLNWAYLSPLFFDPRGQVMGAIALGGVGFGVYLMIRMGKLNV